jgi:putative oxidoreductase
MKTCSASLFLLRLVFGGLLAGHGAQKLFGAFGGHGIKGTGEFMEMLGLRPGERWAMLAGASEFGGGLLTALGLGGSIGPVTTLAPMAMATGTAHWGKPIWATEGGAELPVINATIGTALALSGPGQLSLDHMLGIRVPAWMNFLTLAGVGAGVAYALMARQLAAAEAEATAPVGIDEAQQERIREIDEHQAAA